MFKTIPFYDLCIQEEFFTHFDLEKSIKQLYDLGYRTIAVNQTVEDGNIEPKKKKKKGETRESQEVVPVPYDLSRIHAVLKKLEFDEFQVFNRLTISFSSPDLVHKIVKSPNYKKYHILAALPLTAQAFAFTTGTFEADIFTYNPENALNIRFNRKLYGKLIERGYHFELQYSHAIEDSTKRKNLIRLSHLYHSFGKSRNIIFSSGASDPLYIRNPYDVITFGILFGLSELQCKTSISHCSQKVIFNSVRRRHGKAVMFVENLEDVKETSIISLGDSDDENMEIDGQPLQKKTKTVV